MVPKTTSFSFSAKLLFLNLSPALAIVVESPQRGTSEDLQRKARPLGEGPNSGVTKRKKPWLNRIKHGLKIGFKLSIRLCTTIEM